MLEKYNAIRDHYSEFYSEKYGFERIKKLPFKNNGESIVKIMSARHMETILLVKYFKDMYEENNTFFKNRNSLADFLEVNNDEEISTLLSKNFAKLFSQLVYVAENLKIDCTAVQKDFENLCSLSLKKLSFIDESVIFFKKYLIMDREYGYADEELKTFIQDDILALKESHKSIFDYITNQENLNPEKEYNELLLNFNAIIDKTIKLISSYDCNALNTMSDLYEINNDLIKTPVSSFLFDKKNENNVTLDLKLTESQKIQELKIFIDGSIAYKKEGNFKSLKTHSELTPILTELEDSIINYVLRKKPTVGKFFTEKHKDDFSKFGHLDSVLITIDTFLNNEQILKNSKFDILKLKEHSFEVIDDLMHKSINKHALEQYSLSIMSNKYKHLISDNSLSLFEILKNNSISKKELQNMVGSKIAAIKNSEELDLYLQKLINHYSGFNKENLFLKLNNNNIESIYDKDNIVIFEVKEFSHSKILGSPSWCISRSINYFEEYTSDDCRQFFYYDFNKDEKDNESMIGFTLYKNGNFRTQHLKNDNYYTKTKNFENIVDSLLYKLKDEFELSDIKLASLKIENNKNILKRINNE